MIAACPGAERQTVESPPFGHPGTVLHRKRPRPLVPALCAIEISVVPSVTRHVQQDLTAIGQERIDLRRDHFRALALTTFQSPSIGRTGGFQPQSALDRVDEFARPRPPLRIGGERGLDHRGQLLGHGGTVASGGREGHDRAPAVDIGGRFRRASRPDLRRKVGGRPDDSIRPFSSEEKRGR
jgi:hypothetical protein